VDCLNVLSQHSHGENEKKYRNPVRLFDYPNLLPGSEDDYAPLYSDYQVI
jgi:hypothetical protein